MNKIIGIITTVLALTSTATLAEESMEKCKVTKDGKGLIKANMTDCAGKNHSCAGQNKAGDPESWIVVPKGQCKKINAGDFSGVNDAIKNKIDLVKHK